MGSGEKYDRINIFSLASGHLYERFLRIMMVSVMKNTRHPVKFWLLNNYLSPQFRVRKIDIKNYNFFILQETLPVMAAHYGFDYQLIEYKWPRWLHQQTEKQRVMWGSVVVWLFVCKFSFQLWKNSKKNSLNAFFLFNTDRIFLNFLHF